MTLPALFAQTHRRQPKRRESFPSPRKPVVAWKTPESTPRVPEILKLQNANQVLTQSQDRHPRFAVSSSTPVMHPTRRERVTYSSLVCSSFHEKLQYLSGFFQDQNRIKVVWCSLADAGGNLWTCYHQRGGFVTSTLTNHFNISDIRSCR